MAQKIKDDQINLDILVNTSEAQQSIQQLNGSIRQSEATIREHKKALAQLVAQGKQNTDEYRRLEKAVQDERAAVKLNTAELKKQTNALNLDQLSMNQLRKRAADLKRELDSLVKATNKDKWEEINRKYKETIRYMGELNGKVKETGTSLTDIFKNRFSQFTAAGNIMSSIIGAVVDKIKAAAAAVRDFLVEGVRLASVAEGVTAAFNKLNRPDLLKNLRAETKGLLTDFQLMQTAVRANNFSIPLENPGAILKFAQQRAQETGESVDYLTDRIVLGIGRKSAPIMDDLGISLERIQQKVKTAGDFTQAAISIVNEELKKQGDLALTVADSATQASVKWENAQTKAGEKLLGVSNLWNKFSGAVADWTAGIIDKYLPKLIGGLEYIINEFVDLYNKMYSVRIAVNALIADVRMVFLIIKTTLDYTIASLKMSWELLKSIITLDFSGLKAAWNDFNKSMLENAGSSAGEFSDIWTSLAGNVNRKLNKISLSGSPVDNTFSPSVGSIPSVGSGTACGAVTLRAIPSRKALPKAAPTRPAPTQPASRTA